MSVKVSIISIQSVVNKEILFLRSAALWRSYRPYRFGRRERACESRAFSGHSTRGTLGLRSLLLWVVEQPWTSVFVVCFTFDAVASRVSSVQPEHLVPLGAGCSNRYGSVNLGRLGPGNLGMLASFELLEEGG